MQAEAVVFDVGRVLYQWHLRHLFEKLVTDPARLDMLLVASAADPELRATESPASPPLPATRKATTVAPRTFIRGRDTRDRRRMTSPG